LRTLELPPNPHRGPGGALTPAAERGEQVFRSEKAGCSVCHSGSLFTDGQIHDVGLGSSDDRYQGYNTPSLLGAYRKVRLLHSGRATSLEELLSGPHNPANVTGMGELTDEERQDLVAYLMSL
jgi:cytochrome c peroxidase